FQTLLDRPAGAKRGDQLVPDIAAAALRATDHFGHRARRQLGDDPGRGAGRGPQVDALGIDYFDRIADLEDRVGTGGGVRIQAEELAGCPADAETGRDLPPGVAIRG